MKVRFVTTALTVAIALPAFAAEPSFPAWSKNCEFAYVGAFVGTLSHSTGVDYALNLATEIKFNPNAGELIRAEAMAGRLDPYALLDATFLGLDAAKDSKACSGQLNAVAARRRAFEAAAPEIIRDYLTFAGKPYR